MNPSVLVLKPSSFGDIIHTLPAVAWIKRIKPAWRIAWLVNTEWVPLLAGNATVDELIVFPRREFRGFLGFGRFARWVGKEMHCRCPELALDFQGLLRTALIAKFSGSKFIQGLSDAREGASWFYNRTVPIPTGAPHAIERYLALAGEAIGSKTPAASELEYPLPAGTLPTGARDLIAGDYVLLHPFSRGEGKSFTTWQTEQICRCLAHRRQIVVVGRDHSGRAFSLPNGCINFLNHTNLNELIWIIRHAAFVISVDSGPMHLAAALDKPLVSIHTWSDPRKVGPYRPNAWVWKNGEIYRFSQRHEWESAFYKQSPREIQPSDIEAIAALALAEAPN